MSEKHGYWLHHRVKDDNMVGGWKFLMKCDCSQCGGTANMEKDVCPYCGAVMDLEAPDDAMGPVEDGTEESSPEEEGKEKAA